MMLKFTRKKEEGLYIGDDVRVVLLEIKGSQVRIGISASKDVSVCHQELLSRLYSSKESEKAGSAERWA